MTYARWPQRHSPVIQISLPYIIEFVAAIDHLDGVKAGKTIGDVYGFVYVAKLEIDQLYGGSVYSRALRSSRELSTALSNALGPLMQRAMTDVVSDIEAWSISFNRDKFRTAFLAELGVMPTFFVTQKGGFDTPSLLTQGNLLFPPDLHKKAPETIADVGSACRAVAFDLGTAAGFHIFRVLEAVLRRYYVAVAGGAAAPKVRTIGTYVRAMRKLGCGDPVVLATLNQIRDLHRNPLVHPEAQLTADQAVSLVGVVRSAIEAMLTALPEVSAYPAGGLASLFAIQPSPAQPAP